MMAKFTKPFHLFFYFVISLIFLESIFRAGTTGEIFTFGLLVSLAFSVSLAAAFFIICSLFGDKTNHMLASALLVLTGLIFSSQMIYFKFFRTFYTVFSAGNVTQIVEFWKDIGILIMRNFLWIFPLFLPALVIATWGKKIVSFKKMGGFYRSVLIYTVVAAHVLGLGAVFAGGREPHSAYGLYFQNTYPLLSLDRLGLLTTMRLDLQRLAFGWPLKASAPPPYDPPEPIDDISDEPKEQELEEEIIEYNILNIDFAHLTANEENETLNNMHTYFSKVPPTAKNEYTGKYAGYNLILITAESFAPYAAHREITPTLYKLVHEGYHFTNFYVPLWDVSTSDGEYVALTSLIPKSGVWSFHMSGGIGLPFVMGNQLKNLGYKTVAYHNHTYTYYRRQISHPNMGYVYKGIGNGLVLKKTWPASDLEMMQKTIPEYIGSQPFHAYYMTVSGHLEYNFSGNSMAAKNKKYVQDLPYSTQGKAYMATQVELDRALEHLLNQLQEAGIAHKTLIALSSDHYPYGLDHEVIDQLSGHDVERNFGLFKSPFILYVHGMEPVTIEKPCSSLDIIPTLSNLLGLEYDSRLLMGRDIFSDADPLVIFRNRSFITDKGSYDALTREFSPAAGVEVDEGYINRISRKIDSKFYYSAKILDMDYYRQVLLGFNRDGGPQ